MVKKKEKGTVYLIHFRESFKHARHYIGWTDDETPTARLERHRTGNGARLLAVVAKAGIGYELVRTWENADRTFERKLKSRGGAARICPVCRGEKSLVPMTCEEVV